MAAPVSAQSILPASDGTGTTVTSQGNQFDITGGTLSGDRTNLFHSFQQFGLDPNQVANFISNPQIQNILGKVTGGDPSVINGLIQVTGGNSNLFLLNPAGLIFGPTASLNVPAAFTASTATGLRFGDQWWSVYGTNPYSLLVGNPDGFALLQAGSIVNAGNLIANPGQSVTLVGGTVVNTGTIATPGGKVTIAALPGERWVRFSQEGSVLSLDLPLQDREKLPSSVPLNPLALPELLTGSPNNPGLMVQSGKIDVSSANTPGGAVQISSRVALLDGQINASGVSGGQVRVQGDRLLQSGQILADGQRDAGGQVQIQLQERGIQTSSGLISAQGGSQGKGGTIRFQGGMNPSESVTPGLFLSGQIDASGQQGGTVQILGRQLDLYDAQVRANGMQGGGTILVGGDFQGRNPTVPNADRTTLNFSATLQANALQNGAGGRVIVWANQQTEFSGTIQARGGLQRGDGGFVEVSGKENLLMGGRVEVNATNGQNGALLLDPKNIIISESTGVFPQFDLVDPNQGGGSSFGYQILALNTGNILISKPKDNFTATNAGSVYLYNGLTGGLISTLTGSSPEDNVGSSLTTLSNGNFVVGSPNWNFGTLQKAGAATWGSGITGVNGPVSLQNSLIGATASNVTGSAVTALTNGNYVVLSPGFLTGGLNPGAATWGNGVTGTTGLVSASNSLVGTGPFTAVGLGVQFPSVTALSNGNYVINNPIWRNPASNVVGAVTWVDGTQATLGVVSEANSLVGVFNLDRVGIGGVFPLPNGNYVVSSPSVNSFKEPGQLYGSGAVTWGNGATGTVGVVSAANSLVGRQDWIYTKRGDSIGSGGITVLSNGNYVVNSPYWLSEWIGGGVVGAGAVTWGDGLRGVMGEVNASNSLVGRLGDQVGAGGITALTNENYGVSSPDWDDGVPNPTISIGGIFRPIGGIGAVTWGNGTTGTTGYINSQNSLVGTSLGDRVGSREVVALTNGNFVVNSPEWRGGLGAVTWGDGTTGTIGQVSEANSLVGTMPGESMFVIALKNGNYIVSTPNWDNGSIADVGAITWGDGTGGTIGRISADNSLIGASTNDRIGGPLVVLANGNYVVSTPRWDHGSVVDVGAVTWVDGSRRAVGVVSAANSLTGSQANDQVGSNVIPLSDGNYLVLSPAWSNGTTLLAGAATWVNGSSGRTIDGIGTVTPQNSIVGRNSDTRLSSFFFPTRQFILEDQKNGTFLTLFENDPPSGRVTVGFTNPNQLTFSRAETATLTITPGFLQQTLNNGTDVVLQASNDITLNSNLGVNNPTGNGGNLTLQAGRSILLNGSITTDNGNLTLLANQPRATGVVDSQRDAGAAAIGMAVGTRLDTGSGNVTISLDSGTGLINNTADGITLSTINTSGTLLLNSGAAVGKTIGSVITAGTIRTQGVGPFNLPELSRPVVPPLDRPSGNSNPPELSGSPVEILATPVVPVFPLDAITRFRFAREFEGRSAPGVQVDRELKRVRLCSIQGEGTAQVLICAE